MLQTRTKRCFWSVKMYTQINNNMAAHAAAPVPCVQCQRDYEVPLDAFHNSSATFFLSSDDVIYLRDMKQLSFQNKVAKLMFSHRDIRNHTPNHDISTVTRPDRARVVEPGRDLPWGQAALSRINWTRNDVNADTNWVQFGGERTVIRTMPDRSANINDLTWLINIAEGRIANGRNRKDAMGIDAFYLHKNTFVWISIVDPPRRTAQEQNIHDNYIDNLIYDLQSYFIFWSWNFAALNQLMANYATIEYFYYPSGNVTAQPAVMRPGTTCTLCRKVFPMPEDAIKSPALFGDGEYYLTNGDMMKLVLIKNASFNNSRAQVGFINRVVSNAGIGRELASRLAQAANATTVDQAPADRPGYLRSFGINIMGARKTDPMWDSHNGEGTLFRTMPDRNADISDLTWLLETAVHRSIGMNAFFLHKRHFVWVVIIAPVSRTPQALAAYKSNARNVITSVFRRYSLKKRNIPAINHEMRSIGGVAYHKYPSLTWMESITENMYQHKLMTLSPMGLLIMWYSIRRYYSRGRETTNTTGDAETEKKANEGEAKESIKWRGNEPAIGGYDVEDGNADYQPRPAPAGIASQQPFVGRATEWAGSLPAANVGWSNLKLR